MIKPFHTSAVKQTEKKLIMTQKELIQRLQKSLQQNESPQDAIPRNPFCVPNNYFEDFTERLMKKLPEPAQKSKPSLLLHFWRYAAAVVLVVGVGIGYISTRQISKPTLSPTQAYVIYNDPIDEDYNCQLLDYTLLNNQDIEYYLTKAD